MYWLFKEDPESYSFAQLEKDRRTVWEGVRNNLALKHLRQVKKGDLIFYYETGDTKSVMGIMKASGDAYSKDKSDLLASKEIAVDVVPIKKLKNPVSLQKVKASSKFKDFLLVRISRLSVMPVTNDQWEQILKISETA
jgi:predicted RNA-binding protein with PUA-like domain